VIIASGQRDLVVARADASADRGRSPEVHRRARDAAHLANRDEIRADRSEAARAQGELVAEDVFAGVKIEIPVVGEVQIVGREADAWYSISSASSSASRYVTTASSSPG